MKINLDRYLEQELEFVSGLFNMMPDCKQIDTQAFEIKFNGRQVILVIYPELLRYGYNYRQGNSGDNVKSEDHSVVWIACRVEFEGEQNTPWHRDALKELKDYIGDNLPLKPFYDEDATQGIFAKKVSPYGRDYTKYIFYVNPDFTEGWWENHALG